jgi:hypothetical protein
VATLDADVRIAVPEPESLDLLAPVYEYCRKRGYHPEGEAVLVGDWPVQFIPAFDPLTEEAMEEAETGDLEGTPLRVVRADHLAVIALGAGRAKHHARILSLLEAEAVTCEEIESLAARHGLSEAWRGFQARFDEA